MNPHPTLSQVIPSSHPHFRCFDNKLCWIALFHGWHTHTNPDTPRKFHNRAHLRDYWRRLFFDLFATQMVCEYISIHMCIYKGEICLYLYAYVYMCTYVPIESLLLMYVYIYTYKCTHVLCVCVSWSMSQKVLRLAGWSSKFQRWEFGWSSRHLRPGGDLETRTATHQKAGTSVGFMVISCVYGLDSIICHLMRMSNSKTIIRKERIELQIGWTIGT